MSKAEIQLYSFFILWKFSVPPGGTTGYATGDHADGEHDENLSWFDRRDKDYQELQKIILNRELLASFKYYTRFRYRKIVDNHLLYYDKFIDKSSANSLGLVYTPKRTPFR